MPPRAYAPSRNGVRRGGRADDASIGTVIDCAAVENWSFDEVPYHYTERDTMLYALAIGLGRDPLDGNQVED
jgi:hypothetical protein